MDAHCYVSSVNHDYNLSHGFFVFYVDKIRKIFTMYVSKICARHEINFLKRI